MTPRPIPRTIKHVGPHGARIDLINDHEDARHRIYEIVDADGNPARLTGMEINALVKAHLDNVLDGGEH